MVRHILLRLNEGVREITCRVGGQNNKGFAKNQALYSANYSYFSSSIISYLIYLCFFHLASAAFLDISARFLGESFLARAFPPFNPPFLPILARYFEMAERFEDGFIFFSWGCSFSSVEILTISAANWFGSFGSFLERLMHIIYQEHEWIVHPKVKK